MTAEGYHQSSIKGERTMARGFIAQYAAEAALQAEGVASLDSGSVTSLKEAAGLLHEGSGVRVMFQSERDTSVTVTVYPVVFYGQMIPEVAWQIQERVKADVEKYTGLTVEAVNVHVKGVVAREAGQTA
ncbi:MAG: Asp23/Gls24 family envelope stress response protein [Eubacteriales bacterium]|nr:Asp23/Gls24 family envelope stress response protein [Eubacteriales bacterium]